MGLSRGFERRSAHFFQIGRDQFAAGFIIILATENRAGVRVCEIDQNARFVQTEFFKQCAAQIPFILARFPPAQIERNQKHWTFAIFVLQGKHTNMKRTMNSFSDVMRSRAPVARINSNRRRNVGLRETN